MGFVKILLFMELDARFFVKLYLLLTIVSFSPLGNCYYLNIEAITNRICSGLFVPET